MKNARQIIETMIDTMLGAAVLVGLTYAVCHVMTAILEYAV